MPSRQHTIVAIVRLGLSWFTEEKSWRGVEIHEGRGQGDLSASLIIPALCFRRRIKTERGVFVGADFSCDDRARGVAQFNAAHARGILDS